jgi:hypothetical protein
MVSMYRLLSPAPGGCRSKDQTGTVMEEAEGGRRKEEETPTGDLVSCVSRSMSTQGGRGAAVERERRGWPETTPRRRGSIFGGGRFLGVGDRGEGSPAGLAVCNPEAENEEAASLSLPAWFPKL